MIPVTGVRICKELSDRASWPGLAAPWTGDPHPHPGPGGVVPGPAGARAKGSSRGSGAPGPEQDHDSWIGRGHVSPQHGATKPVRNVHDRGESLSKAGRWQFNLHSHRSGALTPRSSGANSTVL